MLGDTYIVLGRNAFDVTCAARARLYYFNRGMQVES